MKTIHAVNAAPWHPCEETQTLQTNKQTDRQTDYYTPLVAARPRVNNDAGACIATVVFSCVTDATYDVQYRSKKSLRIYL